MADWSWDIYGKYTEESQRGCNRWFDWKQFLYRVPEPSWDIVTVLSGACGKFVFLLASWVAVGKLVGKIK